MSFPLPPEFVDVLQCPHCLSPFIQRAASLECEKCGFEGPILSANLVSLLPTGDSHAQLILRWPREAVGLVEAALIHAAGRSNTDGVQISDCLRLLGSMGLLSGDQKMTALGSLLQYNSLEYTWQKDYDVLEDLIAVSQLGSPPRILDIGCGSGQTLRQLAIPAGGMCIGVDCSVESLAYGSLLTCTNRNILFCCASAHNLPICDKSFDLVICRGSINYCSQKRLLKEAIRVLRPGGWLFGRVERIWWDLNVLFHSRSLLPCLYGLRNLFWGLLHDMTGLQPQPGGIVRGSRAYASNRRLKRLLEPFGCRIVVFESSRRGPQFWGHGTQAKLLCRREIHDSK